jgi:hypothetical protein
MVQYGITFVFFLEFFILCYHAANIAFIWQYATIKRSIIRQRVRRLSEAI